MKSLSLSWKKTWRGDQMGDGAVKPAWFRQGLEAGWIRRSEEELVRFLEGEFGELNQSELLISVFLSLFEEEGHVVLPLYKTPPEWGEILGVDHQGISVLRSYASSFEISELSDSALTGKPGEMAPYIMDKIREKSFVSINRYRNYEEKIDSLIRKKSSATAEISEPEKLKKQLDELFDNVLIPDWQKAAAALSFLKTFLIISGGPGTGKTTTVARIIALHQNLNLGKLKIGLAAPTGKAAGRMGEAIQKEMSGFELSDEMLANIPTEAKTIHRMLSGTSQKGLLPDAEKRKLHYDLLIVDEASMIDLRMMYRLLTALDERTRLILLGDRSQLASVEAGSVFADLCRKTKNGFSEEIAEKLSDITGFDLPVSGAAEADGLHDATIYLTKSFRFDESSGIGKLAALVKADGRKDLVRADEPEELFESLGDIEHSSFTFNGENLRKLADDLLDRLEKTAAIDDPETMLKFWKEGAMLTCHRRGLEGSDRLNAYMEQMIAASRKLPISDGWYHGRPVIITRNDYSLGVFNGDTGVCVREEGKSGSYRVWVDSAGGMKPIHPNRLMHVNPAYFLTVHKSQGSEYNRVTLLLPSEDSPVLTRELLYTAITRARSEFRLLGSLELFCKGINRETERFTMLGMR
ncbi:exodeoxyribonuclease V subunit alpha [Rhodohalobacter mucosus]|uniref:Exodeoxyribonuclease V subunit alpha n=1 Tax=Rhodohalobacter mucosus TaxID=2079485 RepID=A0A316TXP7_9BACT|nr:exodeoxyribonuclease V subunit alpha [Rhodohalobacter mucosus]PWN07452.1 exodeoxyribonuclease V subunit alpha [Rhodohalobacter mucosus]